MPSDTVFDAAALTTWARRLLEARGVDPDKADAVAAVLVEADLLGHDTHGLALLGSYSVSYTHLTLPTKRIV